MLDFAQQPDAPAEMSRRRHDKAERRARRRFRALQRRELRWRVNEACKRCGSFLSSPGLWTPGDPSPFARVFEETRR